MKLAEILNLIAIIIIPIIAVLIGQWLQTRSEKRKDKMHIFKTIIDIIDNLWYCKYRW